MRYGPQHKALTRRRIVAAAGRSFRKRGYHATGVDQVMKAAGLTAGGFYAHFRSKDALLLETVAAAMQEGKQQLESGLDRTRPAAWVRGIIERYLSREHAVSVERGCPAPPLIAELARAGRPIRRAFELRMLERRDEWAAVLGPADGLSGEERAAVLFGTMLGVMSMARAFADPALMDQVLAAARRFLIGQFVEPLERAAAAGNGESA